MSLIILILKIIIINFRNLQNFVRYLCYVQLRTASKACNFCRVDLLTFTYYAQFENLKMLWRFYGIIQQKYLCEKYINLHTCESKITLEKLRSCGTIIVFFFVHVLCLQNKPKYCWVLARQIYIGVNWFMKSHSDFHNQVVSYDMELLYTENVYPMKTTGTGNCGVPAGKNCTIYVKGPLQFPVPVVFMG